MPDERDVRKTSAIGQSNHSRVEKFDGGWCIGSLSLGRQILRARTATRQAGFTSEAIPQGYFRHHPILLSDGPLHDEQRKKVARFFAPAVVEHRYGARIRSRAEQIIDGVSHAGSVDVDALALTFSVDVARKIVGLDRSSLRGMSRRLVSFFTQPPVDVAKPGYGRTRRQWARAGLNALVPLVRFYVRDVRPAIRAAQSTERREGEQTVIDHLLQEGYSNRDILVECVTFATAGMVTTRELITMACWHLLEDDVLRARYRAAPQAERVAIVEEILRLEPVVAHLYRRVHEPVEIVDGDETWLLEPGELVDISVQDANVDRDVVGGCPYEIHPGRPVPPGVDATGLSFSDGAHRCPGRPLALAETEIFLTTLFSRDPVWIDEPVVTWDSVIAGYRLRGLGITFN